MAGQNASKPADGNVPPLTVKRPVANVLQAITSARRPERIAPNDWAKKSSVDQLRMVTPGAGSIQLARADVRGGQIFIRPERSDFPSITLPNNVGAVGFSPGWMIHDYLAAFPAPPTLRGPVGLAAIGAALIANPTPGKDQPSTPVGTRNDVGDLVPFDGDTNFVRSYVRPSDDPRTRSVTVVNYTIKGEHAMDEGFVLRFAELKRDQAIDLITYGEGTAFFQSFMLQPIWPIMVERAWQANAREIFASAAGGGR